MKGKKGGKKNAKMPFAKCHAEKREFEIENVKCQGKIEKEKREYEMSWKKKFQVRRAQTKRYFQGGLNIASKPKIWVITDETFHLDLQDLHVLYNSYQ